MKDILMKRNRAHRLITAAAALGAGAMFAFSPGSVASAAVTHQQITGSGSSWAANAVNQWVADVQQDGLQVVFTADGSASGRRDFADQTSDFAVTDIGYQGVDPDTGASDTPCSNPSVPSTCLDYAYVPIVAGGTSFPYQIREGGQLVRNLRLSGETLVKIFTGKITNWDDPEITADNNGRKLPSLPIIPVVHSEGSGSSAQFTQYMATDYKSMWAPFNDGKDVEDEYYPTGKPGFVYQNGSDGVIDFVTSAAANGAIGYDEYSYAKGKDYPVVNLENKAGYFTAPTQYNVAVALTKAQINYDKSSKNYLLQNLTNVYINPDPRAYAMSSYSYGLIATGPNSNDARMNTPKRQTIADFLYYAICQGQAEIGPIGYSALPINLVEASFAQVNKLHAVDPGVQLAHENVSTCHNPTFIAGHPTENYLAKIAPEPLPCAKVGHGPCPADAGTGDGNPQGGKAPTSSPSPTSTSSTGTGGKKGKGTGGSVPPVTTTGAPNPYTGQPTVAGQPGGTTGTLIGSPTDVAASSNGGIGGVLAALAGIELLIIIALPPFIASRLRKRKGVT
jgi:phosphate transport system substrate-binding protein